ncbi:palmitoyl-acyl carrier protein thioesterase, chloroplastic [Ziziphus jujuba]|uniref:Acyl-[acyl-carrier-protein] hydrolase n=1 Tax=Ziziphus jujuba TaxID=326968 RepID=A0A6P3Z5F8_ZIZJJ|nr:palmitoyl-acyl carrier protein thioesterase, chloroplastic [Ziziphus jujuba]
MTMVEHLSVSRSFTMLLPYYSTSSAMKRRTIRCVDSSTSTSEIKPNSIPAATPLQLNLSAAESSKKIKAVEERLERFNWKSKQLDKIVEIFSGRLLECGLVFEQNFLIRSSELGADSKASIGALTNILQESALNHVKGAGILAEGFGSTPEMSRRNLIWVVYRMQIVVDSYPSWGDVIQVNTWTCASGRNGMRREWIVRDYKTGKTLLRAACVYVMMNKTTRKISKFIKEIREETKNIFMEITEPIINHEDAKKLRALDVDTADNVQAGLLPKWSDLDVNQHVKHVKYIEWILESAPRWILETHELSIMTLEFQKECGMNTSLQSLSAVANRDDHRHHNNKHNDEVELEHTIRVENESQILLKGRTMWLLKIS